MEDSQYKTIEEQALQIVGVLNKLKEEIESYRDVKIETQQSLDSFDALLDAIANAAEQLSNTANDLKNSDYIELHKKLSEKTELLTAACDNMQQNLEVIPGQVETMLESQCTKQDEARSVLVSQIERALKADSNLREATQQEMEEACESVINKFNELPTVIAASLGIHDAKQAEKDKELSERISSLEQIILRIDRNTQKGFGKERG